MRLNQTLLTSFALLLLISFSLTTQGSLIPGDNFYVVDPGKLYRSAQMDPWTLQQKIKTYGFKTVVNLRGASPGVPWFDQEAAVAKSMGVLLVNIPLTASQIPTRTELLALLNVYEKAPRPILIHCRVGADRSGEAAGIYLYDLNKGNRGLAMTMLSIKYFHLKTRHPAMDYFIDDVYQGAAWAKEHYQPCQENYQYFDKTTSCVQ